jgi:hypothetical protein
MNTMLVWRAGMQTCIIAAILIMPLVGWLTVLQLREELRSARAETARQAEQLRVLDFEMAMVQDGLWDSTITLQTLVEYAREGDLSPALRDLPIPYRRPKMVELKDPFDI